MKLKFCLNEYNLPKVILVLFFVLYGYVPYILDHDLGYTLPWSTHNFFFALLVGLFCLFLPDKLPYRLSNYLPVFSSKPSNIFIILLFLLCLVIFYFFPWSVDRTSIGAQLAAVFRACWLFLCFSCVDSSNRKSILLIVLTLLLMFIDQSRTYFLICLLPIFSVVKQKQLFLVFGILAMLLVASLRSSASFHQLLSYGIVGEAYNATNSWITI